MQFKGTALLELAQIKCIKPFNFRELFNPKKLTKTNKLK